MQRKSIFKTKVKSQRRADNISITSPTAFKKSITELKKGNYSTADQRALQLAKNRATAQLNRKNLSAKERKQMREISKTNIPKAKK